MQWFRNFSDGVKREGCGAETAKLPLHGKESSGGFSAREDHCSKGETDHCGWIYLLNRAWRFSIMREIASTNLDGQFRIYAYRIDFLVMENMAVALQRFVACYLMFPQLDVEKSVPLSSPLTLCPVTSDPDKAALYQVKLSALLR